MVKTRRKNDIKYPIITYKDSDNNSFEYQPEQSDIEELLEQLIGENTTQDETGLIYINNDENCTCNEEEFKEKLSQYIKDRIEELFISYYDMIKEHMQEQAMCEYSPMAEDDLVYDSKIPPSNSKIIRFDKTENVNENRIKVLANKLDISVSQISDTQITVTYGSFKNIIQLVRQLGIITDNQKIALEVYYNASSDIYSLDQILNKSEKTNVYLASYLFDEDIDLIQVVGTPENLDRFLEDTISNYSNDSIYIELRKDMIDLFSKQPLKFKSDKYLGEKDRESMEKLEQLRKDFSEDDIDNVTSGYGDFGASLEPLFNEKYTIKFSKDPYKDVNIGIYKDLADAWFGCFLFAITYKGDINKFKESAFYKTNAIKEEEQTLSEGQVRKNYNEARFGYKYKFKNNLPYDVRTHNGNWLCEGYNQLDNTESSQRRQVLGSFNSNLFTREEAMAYCKVAYKTFESLNFDKIAFRNSDVYKNKEKIAKGNYDMPVEENTSNEENAIYTLTWNVYIDDPFNDEFASEGVFRNVAKRLNVVVEKFEISNEYEGEFNFIVSGKKQNILEFINVLFDFDFNSEEEEIDYLVREGYLKITNV